MVITICELGKDFKDVKAKDFFDLAFELDEIKNELNSTNAAINRNIYMRIYYSVFLFLRDWLGSCTDYVSHPHGEHRRLARYIKSKGPFNNKINNEIYRDLIILKKLRHQADYKLEVPAKCSIEYAEWNFTSINSAFEIAKNIFKIVNDFSN